MFKLLTLAVALLPVYLWSSGLPQVGHIALLMALSVGVMHALGKGLNVAVRIPAALAACLGFWILFVQSMWIVLGANISFLPAAQWLFNVYCFICLSYVLLNVHMHDRVISSLTLGIYGAVILSFASIVPEAFTIESSTRLSGTANNPNQLAYILLCLLATRLVIAPCLRWYDSVLVVLIVTQVWVSASLSGVIGAVFLLVAAMLRFSRPGLDWWRIARRTAFASGALFATAQLPILTDQRDFLFRRWERKTTGFRQDRRLWLDGRSELQQVFGAGEGNLQRFGSSSEIHNSFLSIEFAFGAIGLTLFVALLLSTVSRGHPASHVIALIGILSYGIAHVGHRTPAFWLFLACLVTSHSSRHSGRKRLLHHATQAHGVPRVHSGATLALVPQSLYERWGIDYFNRRNHTWFQR